jgi:hypothetical protein
MLRFSTLQGVVFGGEPAAWMRFFGSIVHKRTAGPCLLIPWVRIYSRILRFVAPGLPRCARNDGF